MDPFHTDPFSPFTGGGLPGDPMEEVLSLQSYPTDGSDSEAALCISDTSVVINCPSNVSSIKS